MALKHTHVKTGLLDFEYCASLSIIHNDLEPDIASQRLNLVPSRSHRKGDPRTTPIGTPLEGVYKSGYWSVKLETLDGEDLAEFLFRIAQQLHPAKEYLRSVVDDGGTIECFIGIFITGLCDQILPAKLLTQLGELGISLRLDYYKFSDNTESNGE